MTKSIIRILFGFIGILASGLMMMDVMSYFEIVGPDNMAIISREGTRPWVVWFLILPCTFYCALTFFNPQGKPLK